MDGAAGPARQREQCLSDEADERSPRLLARWHAAGARGTLGAVAFRWLLRWLRRSEEPTQLLGADVTKAGHPATKTSRKTTDEPSSAGVRALNLATTPPTFGPV